MTVAVCFPACSFLCLCIYAYAHFLAYTHFYGGLGLSLRWCVVIRQYVSTSARMYVSASVRMYVSTPAELCVCPSVRTCLFKCLFPSMSIYLPCCFIVSVRKGIYKSAGLYRFPLAWQHLASVPLSPSGRATLPMRTSYPRLRPSFGQPKGIGRPIPLWVVITGLSPIRRVRILVSLKTQQGVL